MTEPTERDQLLEALKDSSKLWARQYQETKDELLTTKRDLELTSQDAARLRQKIACLVFLVRDRTWPWISVESVVKALEDPARRDNDGK